MHARCTHANTHAHAHKNACMHTHATGSARSMCLSKLKVFSRRYHHLSESEEHKYTSNLERGHDKEEQIVEIETGLVQTTMDNPHNKEAVRKAPLKLFRTAILAPNPTISLSQFKTLA